MNLHDSLAVTEGLLLLGSGLRTVVKTHPAIRNGIDRDNLGFGIRGELVSNDNVNRKEDFLAKLFGLGEDILGSVNKFVLNKGRTNSKTLGLEEGEDHASSDDDLVALVEKSLEDSDFGGNLGSTDNGSHGLLSVLDGTIKVLEFLGEEESRDRRLQELGDTFGGGVGAMGRTECVVDEKVKGSGELLNESWFVLGLLLVESGVLEHDNISLLGGVDNLGNLLTDAVGGKLDFLSEELTHAVGARGEGELVLRSFLGASQVRADRDNGALLGQVLNGGDASTDTSVVSDLLAVEGHVHVASDEDLLSLEFGIAEVFDGLLGLELKDRVKSRDADAQLRACGQEACVRMLFRCKILFDDNGQVREMMAGAAAVNYLRTGAKALTEVLEAARATRKAWENFMVRIQGQRYDRRNVRAWLLEMHSI